MPCSSNVEAGFLSDHKLTIFTTSLPYLRLTSHRNAREVMFGPLYGPGEPAREAETQARRAVRRLRTNYVL